MDLRIFYFNLCFADQTHFELYPWNSWLSDSFWYETWIILEFPVCSWETCKSPFQLFVLLIMYWFSFIEFELKIVDGIVITDMRTAAASAVATKVRRETDLNYGFTYVKPIVAT